MWNETFVKIYTLMFECSNALVASCRGYKINYGSQISFR